MCERGRPKSVEGETRAGKEKPENENGTYALSGQVMNRKLDISELSFADSLK